MVICASDALLRQLPTWIVRPKCLGPHCCKIACACRWAIAGQQGQGGQGETERVCPACRLASC